jgi:urease gamma subunit
MTISFWTNEPTILFNKEYIFELWPTTDMCYEQKLNAITRLVILITILGYILTMSKRVLAVGVITLVVIFVLFKMRKEKVTKEMVNEGFKVLSRENKEQGEPSFVNPVTLESVLKADYKEGTKKNPFSNVLLTQIEDDPERKAAPPSFNVDVDEDITKNVKRSVQMMNPGIKNTNKQLFGDLWQQFELDQSNRIFYSTPNTNVQPGDQASFGQYLYGTMPSGKESTPEGAFARVQDNYRYTLY